MIEVNGSADFVFGFLLCTELLRGKSHNKINVFCRHKFIEVSKRNCFGGKDTKCTQYRNTSDKCDVALMS